MRPEPHIATSSAEAAQALSAESWRVALFAIAGGLGALLVLMAVSFGPRVMPLPTIFIADLRSEIQRADVDPLAASLHEYAVTAFVQDSSKTVVRWRDSRLTAKDSLDRIKLDPRADGAKLLRATLLANRNDVPVVLFELSDAASGESLWHSTYDARTAPFGVLGPRIANDVAKAFGGPPVADEKEEAKASGPTEAILLYWQARHVMGLSDDELPRARALLERALSLSPGYADAHLALAEVYARKIGEEIGLPGVDTLREAEKELKIARELDEDAEEVVVADAIVTLYRTKDVELALDAAEEATVNEPNNAFAWQTRAMLESAMGETDRAQETLERAGRHNPLSASIAWDRVWFTYIQGEAREAKAQADEARRLGPSVLLFEALIADELGNDERALDLWIDRAKRRGWTDEQAAEATQLARRGKTKEAYALLSAWALAANTQAGQEIPNALFALRAGDREAALAILGNLHRGRETPWWLWLEQIPAFADLHDDPRWQRVIDRAKKTTPLPAS
jgi:Tfp pilus assembly protein PilF